MILEPPQNPEAHLEEKQLLSIIDGMLDDLNPREKQVIHMRFGFEGEPKTYREIGMSIGGVGVERARQIEARAIRKLKNPSRSRKLRVSCPYFDVTYSPPPYSPPHRSPPPEQYEKHKISERYLRDMDRRLRSRFPDYARFLGEAISSPNFDEVGEWTYWDFTWPWQNGMTPQQAVDMAIEFNRADPADRPAVCLKHLEMSKAR